MRSHGIENWVWRAKKYDTTCTWSSILGLRKLDLHITLHGLEAHTDMHDGQLGIMSHLKRVIAMGAQDLPIMLKELHIKKGNFVADDPAQALKATLCWTSDMIKGSTGIKADINFHDGTLAQQKTYIDQWHGDLHIESRNNDEKAALSIDGTLSMHVPLLPESENTCCATVHWATNEGTLSIKNDNNLLQSDSIKFSKSDDGIVVEGKASMPLKYGAQICGIPGNDQIKGACSVQLLMNMSGNDIMVNGKASLIDLCYCNTILSTYAHCSFNRADGLWRGDIHMMVGQEHHVEGSVQFNEKLKTGSIALHNDKPISIPFTQGLQIAPGEADLHIEGTLQQGQGTYHCTAAQATQHYKHMITGSIFITPQQLRIQGLSDGKKGEMLVRLQPTFGLEMIQYGQEQKKPVIQLQKSATQPNTIIGSCDFSLMRELLKYAWGKDIQGQGTLSLKATIVDHQVNARIAMKDGIIRLANTYNFVTGFAGNVSYDWVHKKCNLYDVGCWLHRGFIGCDRATFFFNDAFHLNFAHVPLVIESCLLNIKQDLLAQLSGSLLFVQEGNKLPMCKGHVIIERGQLKKNIFADLMPLKTLSPAAPTSWFNAINCACNLTLETRDAIQIQTPFLQTNARLQTHVTGTIEHPKITGYITVSGGSLNFPYKPLFINKGSITLQQNQLSDPLIELTAHNTMRNYQIGLQVTGSRTNPTICLTSTPSLSEEQIVALLLTGLPEGSLNMVMPALVMENLKSLLFDLQPNYPSHYFAGFLKPLRHIRVIPRFSDQTARGGIRGALEIELGERWHASIQSNFSLTEDTRLDLEYIASDNIAVRGFRNEQRDVGGEVEVRWKW